MKVLLILVGLLSFSITKADVLDTPNYRIEITPLCEEGEVVCKDIQYESVSKRSGYRLSQKGESLFSLCKDGVTPCRFLGYFFENDEYRYIVYDTGTFIVSKGDEVLIEESGEWSWETNFESKAH